MRRRASFHPITRWAAGLLVGATLIHPVAARAGEFCNQWSTLDNRSRMLAVAALAEASYGEVHADKWVSIRVCVAKAFVEQGIDDVQKSCDRQGDYSGGFSFGFGLQMAVAVCLSGAGEASQ